MALHVGLAPPARSRGDRRLFGRAGRAGKAKRGDSARLARRAAAGAARPRRSGSPHSDRRDVHGRRSPGGRGDSDPVAYFLRRRPRHRRAAACATAACSSPRRSPVGDANAYGERPGRACCVAGRDGSEGIVICVFISRSRPSGSFARRSIRRPGDAETAPDPVASACVARRSDSRAGRRGTLVGRPIKKGGRLAAAFKSREETPKEGTYGANLHRTKRS